MKKSHKKLMLDTETVRTLRTRDLRPVVGGYPTQTELASGCTVTDGRICSWPGDF
jgi:hypothetical protein